MFTDANEYNLVLRLCRNGAVLDAQPGQTVQSMLPFTVPTENAHFSLPFSRNAGALVWQGAPCDVPEFGALKPSVSQNRTYTDFLNFLEMHPDVPNTQEDMTVWLNINSTRRSKLEGQCLYGLAASFVTQ
ncbi:MAG: hypothetical protein RR900_02825 [Ruthenibacterium sp.]